jgi:hydroxypyruvate isomerase
VPKFAANLSMMFTELPLLERFKAASTAGFEAVEMMFPYEATPAALSQELSANNLKLVLFNLSAGNWAANERGLAIFPDRVNEFQAHVKQAITYATALNCRQLHCLAGVIPEGVPQELLRETYVANLEFAASAAAEHGIAILIEPINTQDVPGYYLTGTDQALDVIAEVAAPNLALQYDCYHMEIMQGDQAAKLENLLHMIGHIQIADTPGRHEPGTGEINYPALFAHLDQLGYAGWIGCEYRPKTTTLEGLGWLKPFLT